MPNHVALAGIFTELTLLDFTFLSATGWGRVAS